MKTYAGDPIDCIHQGEKGWGEYLDWFCFIHGTQSLKYPQTGSVHHTVGPLDCVDDQGNKKDGTDCVQDHPQYLWVAVVVLIQAGITYIPHCLWYIWEGGRMQQLLKTILQKPKFFNENKDGTCRISSGSQGAGYHVCSSGNSLTEDLAKNFIDSIGTNSFYAFKYSVAEFLGFLICLIQLLLTDKFLNGNFLKYGTNVLHDAFSSDLNTQPMDRTFPIVTLCTLAHYGPAGGTESTEAMCVLPNNIVHQKFYLFLWFWLISLTFITCGHLVYRIALYLIPSFRAFMITGIWTGA